MERVTWRAEIKPGKKEEYLKRHNEIWAEMVAELKAAGIENYTIWLDGNQLFGYYECSKGAKYALDYQENSEVVRRWEESMQPIMKKSESTPQQIFELK